MNDFVKHAFVQKGASNFVLPKKVRSIIMQSLKWCRCDKEATIYTSEGYVRQWTLQRLVLRVRDLCWNRDNHSIACLRT